VRETAITRNAGTAADYRLKLVAFLKARKKASGMRAQVPGDVRLGRIEVFTQLQASGQNRAGC
jgi:hypothetical protein